MSKKSQQLKIDTMRRRVLRKRFKKELTFLRLMKRDSKFLGRCVRTYMRNFPTDEIDRFRVHMLRSYNAATWDEIEYMILTGEVADIPRSLNERYKP